jgi:hypothetical protein
MTSTPQKNAIQKTILANFMREVYNAGVAVLSTKMSQIRDQAVGERAQTSGN